MQLGMIGLGRMGSNMVRRLIRNGHDCTVFDRSQQAVSALVKEKATGAASGRGAAPARSGSVRSLSSLRRRGQQILAPHNLQQLLRHFRYRAKAIDMVITPDILIKTHKRRRFVLITL